MSIKFLYEYRGYRRISQFFTDKLLHINKNNVKYLTNICQYVTIYNKERTKESPDIISRKINTRLLMEDNKMKKENAALPYVQAEGRISDSGACKSAPFGVCADNFCSAGHC